jgi:hypothetical protein
MRSAWILVVSACYSPQVPAGSPCSDQHPCPTELVCDPRTSTCQPTATAVDAAVQPDASIDSKVAAFCYGTGLVHACFGQAPAGTLEFNISGEINTDADGRCQAISGSCAIVADHIAVDAGINVRAAGSKPLILLGASGIDVEGTLDAASLSGQSSTGAGADPSACANALSDTRPDGGAGGSFGTPGGSGGVGLMGTAHQPAPAVVATSVRGGCPGEAGGHTGGSGGHGGGAVYLISGVVVTVGGTINASGEGGVGGLASDRGGGGGGAGGLVGLDAPSVTVTGVIFANGGGGGGGAGTTIAGGNGADPSSPIMAAAGGTANQTNGGGPGGAGSVSSGNGSSGSNGNGAGGGGGGAGAVRAFGASQSLGGTISPPPS